MTWQATHDVFLSYRLPEREHKNKLVQWLEAHGYAVAHDELFGPGVNHVEKAKEFIRTSHSAVIILGPDGLANERGVGGFQFAELEAMAEVLDVLVPSRQRPPLGIVCLVAQRELANGRYSPTIDTYPGLPSWLKLAHSVFHVSDLRVKGAWFPQVLQRLAQHYDQHELEPITQRLSNAARKPPPPPISSPPKTDLVSLVLNADKQAAFGVDLLDGAAEPNEDDCEGVVLVKPGGTFFAPALTEIFRRLTSAGVRIVRGRLFDGATIDQKNLFDHQYRTPTQFATGERTLNKHDYDAVRAIYDKPAFKKAFGVPYTDELVRPALALCEESGLSYDELTHLWDQKRESKFFHNGQPNGLNKIGYQKSVCPIRLPDNSVALVVNGFIPGYKQLFIEPSARVIALHVVTDRDWTYVRDDIVGGNSDPGKCKADSIRCDALQGRIPLDPNDKTVNGQRNVCHSSATRFDGANEVALWFDIPLEETLLGRAFQRAGAPEGWLSRLLKEDLPSVSWIRDNSALSKLIYEAKRPHVIAELKAAGHKRTSLIEDYARHCGLPADRLREQPFAQFMENGLRLAIATEDYFLHVCSRQLPPEDRAIFHEIADEISELAAARMPKASHSVLAEAYLIAASDLRFLRCPAFSEVRRPELFRAYVVHELAREALDCALRTENNLRKDTMAAEPRSHGVPHPAMRIGESEAWRQFLGSSPAPAPVAGGLAAIVLAGGRSTRMASTFPKPCLPVGRTLMLRTVCDTIRDAAPDARLLVALGFRGELVKRTFGSDFSYLEFAPTLGLGFRVATCLEQLSKHEGPVLLTYVDMPRLSEGALRALIEQVGDDPKRFGLLVTEPRSGLSGHVVRDDDGDVIAVEQKRLRPHALAQDQERDAGVYVFHNTPDLRAALLEVDNANMRGEFMFADIIGKVAARGYEIVTEPEAVGNAQGVNTPAELLKLSLGLNSDHTDINAVRGVLEQQYGLRVSGGLGAGGLVAAVDHHVGPFYCFDWWQEEWL